MPTTDAIPIARYHARFQIRCANRTCRKALILIFQNEYVALMGPSGSGKSTLMNLLGCLDTPTSGSYELNGTDVSSLNDNALAEIRNSEIALSFKPLTCSHVLQHLKMLPCRWCMQD